MLELVAQIIAYTGVGLVILVVGFFVLDDRSEVLGILSMRDIVRSWTTDGATCEVSAARAG